MKSPPGPVPDIHPAGFSLLELLLVLTIAGVLASWAWPQWQLAQQQAQRHQALQHLQHLALQLQWQQLSTGQWPSQLTPAQTQPSGVFYRFSLLHSSPQNSSSTATALIVQAWPLGPQLRDACGMLWLDTQGNSGASSNSRSPAVCWGRRS